MNNKVMFYIYLVAITLSLNYNYVERDALHAVLFWTSIISLELPSMYSYLHHRFGQIVVAAPLIDGFFIY